MKAIVDALGVLALISALAFFVHQNMQVDAKPATPIADGTTGRGPTAMRGPPTKFDVRFGEPELARP